MARIGLGLARTFQIPRPFAGMTLVENVLLAAQRQSGEPILPNWLLQLAAAVLPRPERRRRIDAMVALFPDLARQKDFRAGKLSGGQRQMLALARALLVDPKLLMLDEASAGLSPKLVEAVFAKIRDIRDAGTTILLVEQNARAALAIGDRAYVLAEGRNAHEGAAAELWSDPAIARLYLGVSGSVAAAGS